MLSLRLGACPGLTLTPAGLPEDCRGRWESFVEETLTETNRRNAVDLVSVRGPAAGTLALQSVPPRPTPLAPHLCWSPVCSREGR